MPTDTCDCPRDHYLTADGRCDNPPLWHDDPERLDRQRYSWCGCCMADCPDVHLEPEPMRVGPGSVVIAEEYVATLPEEKQRELRAAQERGELRIAPRAEFAPDPAKVVILPSALKHFEEYVALDGESD
ncbi:hypothetical protein [Tsukamurella soli]|uniref:4Fe-4S ferredoxin-type domain-containing protein n=1 Tax=Tsukamurella soli TaxID=644556 RepID=A0ABP8KC27_9ACTN